MKTLLLKAFNLEITANAAIIVERCDSHRSLTLVTTSVEACSDMNYAAFTLIPSKRLRLLL
jgi:hypothetical protein